MSDPRRPGARRPRRPGQGLPRRRPVPVLSPDLGRIRIRAMRGSARRRAVLGEDGRQAAGVEEHDLGAGAPPSRGGVAEQAGEALAGVRPIEHPPAVHAAQRIASSPAPSARRSRVRASGCRSRRRRRSTAASDPTSAERLAGQLADVGHAEVDALGDADGEHVGQVVVAEGAQQRPPGDQPGVGAAARRRVDDRRRLHAERPALLDELDVGDQVAERAGRRAAADRDRVRGRTRRGQLVGELLAGDLQLAPVVRRTADVVQLGAEQLGEQLVPGRRGPGACPTARGAPRGRARRRRRPSSGSGWTGRRRR